MRNRKFGLTVSALVLAAQLGGSLAAAEPNLEQLSRIEALLERNDVAGLRAYLERNPDLLEGDTPLASLLSEFMQASSELPDYLGWQGEPRATEEGLGDVAPGSAAQANDQVY